MNTLIVKVDRNLRHKYKLHGNEIEFEDLRRRIIAAEGRKFLRAANIAAIQSGLSTITSKDIEKEIRAARSGSRRR